MRTLWLRNRTYLAENFRRSAPTIHAAENNDIVKLEDIALAIGRHHLESDGLEKLRRDASQRLGQDYRGELMYDLEAQREISERCTFLCRLASNVSLPHSYYMDKMAGTS